MVGDTNHPDSAPQPLSNSTLTEELARQLDRYRELLDSANVIVWRADARTYEFTFVSAYAETLLGYPLRRWNEPGFWSEHIHPDDRGWVVAFCINATQEKRSHELDYRMIAADGRTVWLRDICNVVIENNEPSELVGVLVDVTEKKVAEQALRKSEERWQAVFENSAIGVALTDQSGYFLATNSAYQKMLGYTEEELGRLTFLELTGEDYRESNWQLVAELFEGNRTQFQIEKQYRRKDGSLIWVSNNVSLVPGTESMPQFVMALSEDITERKRLADQLHREYERLRLLLDLNNKFAPKLDIRDVFDALSIGLREVESWEYSFLLLPEPTGELKVQLMGPGMGELLVGMDVPVQGTPAGNVYRSGQPEFFRVADLPPVSDDPQLSRWREFALAEGVKAGWNLPLRYDGKVLGVVGFHTRRDLVAARADLVFLQELAKLVAIALHNARQYGELSESREKLSYQKNYIEAEFLRERGFAEVIGESPAIREVLQQVRVVAPTDSAVLITGETGTGKELIARAIHDRSSRREQSFIKVDSAAIPAGLMESELFGHEKGAFTGATSQKLGRFEIADRGTIFLDEVGDIPLELQTKLLRVLQDHSFERLGSNRTRNVNVRVIAATHRNLEEMVEKGAFREDLYYRLKVFPILIPPLRDRSVDIPALIKYFVEMYARRMQKVVPNVPTGMMDVFVRYPWPGNVRELQHFIERSVILTSGHQLQAPLSELERISRKRARPTTSPRRTLEEIERDAIIQALQESNWAIGGPDGAAARLGLKRTTLASRMERLGISRNAPRSH